MRLHPFKRWRTKIANEGVGISQEEMARLIGTTQARVSKFESGVLPALEGEQAIRAEEISGGYIRPRDCIARTPYALGARPSKRRKSGALASRPSSH